MKAQGLKWVIGLLAPAGILASVPPASWDVGSAPADPPVDARIAPEEEPGTPLIIAGTVYAPDGVTPAAGVTVYAYHTDVHGLYRADRRFDLPPRLRGWARTNAGGHYSFRTIRPAPYPHGSVPAHVHFHLWGPGVPRQYSDELTFADDPLIRQEMQAGSAARPKLMTVCTPRHDPDGAQRCKFDIRAQAQSNLP